MDFRRKTAAVGALVLLTGLVQVWTISRAVVPAQDCVRYMIVAQGFERDGFAATLRVQPEQPLFPAVVWFVHRTLAAAGWASADNWAICLQIAAAVPLVLSVIPVYALFCRLHGEKAALVGSLLYCVLGGIARLGADGLSDSTHLALFCVALWAAARYFATDGARYGSSIWLLLCGCSTGLALTARGEAIVLPAALFATWGLLQVGREKRRAWTAVARGALSVSLGLGVVLTPYLIWSDATTPEAALARLTGRRGAAEAAPLNDLDSGFQANSIEPRWELPGLGRLAFGKKDTSTSGRFHGYLAACTRLLHELAQTLHYWLGALALVGLWSAWRTLVSPLDRFMQCLCATLVAAGIYVAAHAGYLSTRHMLLLVVLGVGWAGVGTLTIADWLATMLRQIRELAVAGADPRQTASLASMSNRGDAPAGSPPGHRWPTVRLRSSQPISASSAPATCQSPAKLRWATFRGTFAFAVVLACACDLVDPLHGSRGAHRDAARWLMENADRSVAVLDSRGWTALYTGRKTYRYEAAQAAFSDPALAYVVVEQAELATDSRRGETMRLLMSHAGEPLARFAADPEKHSVVIHRWRPERFQQLGVQSYAR